MNKTFKSMREVMEHYLQKQCEREQKEKEELKHLHEQEGHIHKIKVSNFR